MVILTREGTKEESSSPTSGRRGLVHHDPAHYNHGRSCSRPPAPSLTAPRPPLSITHSLSSPVHRQLLVPLSPLHRTPAHRHLGLAHVDINFISSTPRLRRSERRQPDAAAKCSRLCASTLIESRGGRLARLMHRTRQTAPVSPSLSRVLIKYSIFSIQMIFSKVVGL